MEKEPEDNTRVQISRAVLDGLEFVRRSGATNMLDRPIVLNLAKEWGFAETAEWIESVDTGIYGRLIFQGPAIMENEPMDHTVEQDAIEQANELDVFNHAWDHERARVQDIITGLGKQAILTIADTYEIEKMGVLIDSPFLPQIIAERETLVRNLGEASTLWLQLQESMSKVERGVGSLRFLIDSENN